MSGPGGSDEHWGGFGGDYVTDGGPGNDLLVGGTNHEDGHDKSETYLLGKMGDDELIGDQGNDRFWGLSVRRVAVN